MNAGKMQALIAKDIKPLFRVASELRDAKAAAGPSLREAATLHRIYNGIRNGHRGADNALRLFDHKDKHLSAVSHIFLPFISTGVL